MSSGDHSPSLRASPAIRVRPGGDQQLRSSGVLKEGLLEEPRRYCKLQPRGLDSQWTHQQQKG